MYTEAAFILQNCMFVEMITRGIAYNDGKPTYHRSQSLSLTASLKAAQLTSNLELLQSTCGTITTRLLVQQALRQFYNGNDTDANWVVAAGDIQAGLDTFGYSTLLQTIIYPRAQLGNIHGLLNVTRSSLGAITLPYSYSNGNVSSTLIIHTFKTAIPNKIRSESYWAILALDIPQCYIPTLHMF